MPDQPAFATVNPYTGRTEREFECVEGRAVDDAVEAAHAAYEQWRAQPVEKRAEIVGRAAELMAERKDELAALLTLEMGKLIAQSEGEVDLAASILAYYAKNGSAFTRETALDVGDGAAVIVHEPLGVLIGVEPWNFPLYQVVRFAAPNLVLGNTILLKHAEICPQSALALAAVFHDAGMPEHVYTNLFVSHDEIARVIAHPLGKGASLTGSERAGASVAEVAARNLKKCVLELGGSDPFLVLDAENLDRTVAAAAAGRLGNNGQSCVAAKRFVVLDDVYDDFVAGLRTLFARLKIGDPADRSTTLGPLSSERAAAMLAKQVRDAVDAGAKIVIGGGRPDHPGAFVDATILTDVTPDMAAFKEELFGPVAVVYRVADDNEAVALANATDFGLGGSVFCADPVRARRVADRIESGMVWINHPTSTRADLPFGGIKRSGFGRELSELGMREFTNAKLVRTFPSDAPLGNVAG
ncbi:NAD-dependent succinate-semialdehyde dehydrogenase [Streptomyces sp. SID3343]|uniref:NAD-dependent succinate-semialdehyde dehydrogenase n=1 Tax=Streptomyces sp. SID3343 TaxID=2690260 RepID=UPI0013700266|nr:NAD-dependent succinate-semialdehyde dehydrogenase [Streptomyces sp. SID3343]MYV99319.1 aldehyde dehydrogenase family protein [Streptomyces sp. SID3343]